MNAQTPYWPLFRNELALDHYPRIGWSLAAGSYFAVWCLAGSLPVVILIQACEGNLATYFAAFGDLFGFALVWWLGMAGWLFAFAMLPGISNPVQAVRAFEFMFTRAIDRRRLFRCRILLIWAVMLGPLLLDVLATTRFPQITFGPDDSNASQWEARRIQYARSFPASHPKDEKAPIGRVVLVVPRAALALTSWTIWLGAFSLLAMQIYCVTIAKHVQHNPWLAGFAIGLPVFLVCLLAPWVPRHLPGLYESGYLFFARNSAPLVIGLLIITPFVQLFSERKFDRLEIL